MPNTLLHDSKNRLACESAAVVLLVHTHPSGNPASSRKDLELAKRLREAAKPWE